MRGFIWKGDRFSWWFIALVAFFSMYWVAIDIIWRVVEISIIKLLVLSIAAAISMLLISILIWRRANRSHS